MYTCIIFLAIGPKLSGVFTQIDNMADADVMYNFTFNLVSIISIGYTPRARLLNHWATKPEVCNQLVL